MKLLVLMILFSSFPSSTYASNEPIELKEIDVTGIIDEELISIERQLEEVKVYNRNGTKKVDKLNKVQQHVSELIPKQIELAKDRKNLNKVIDLKNKYINCISTKDEEDCSDFKDELEKLNIKSSASGSTSHKTYVTNPHAISKIKGCSNVTHEYFHRFTAVILLDISVDAQGNVQNIRIDHEEAVMSHDLPVFSKCVAHFARYLNFYNPSGLTAQVSQNFIFGKI